MASGSEQPKQNMIVSSKCDNDCNVLKGMFFADGYYIGWFIIVFMIVLCLLAMQ